MLFMPAEDVSGFDMWMVSSGAWTTASTAVRDNYFSYSIQDTPVEWATASNQPRRVTRPKRSPPLMSKLSVTPDSFINNLRVRKSRKNVTDQETEDDIAGNRQLASSIKFNELRLRNVFELLEKEVEDCFGGQGYLFLPILPNESSYYAINAFCCALWDNIVGPKAILAWTQNDSPSQYDLQDAIEYCVSRTLHTELDREKYRDGISVETYLVNDCGFMIFTAAFHAPGPDNVMIPCSLSAILPSEKFSSFVALQPLMSLWMKKIARKYRSLAADEDRSWCLYQITNPMLQLFSLVSSLTPPGSFSVGNSLLSPAQSVSLPFLECAITSHLHTSGCTIVLGDSVDEINMMLRTLALFLTEEERVLIRFASSRHNYPCQLGLLLQGVLKNALSMSSPDALQTDVQTTIIDVSSHLVLQLHSSQRLQYDNALLLEEAWELLSIPHPVSSRDLHPNLSSARSVFQRVEEKSRMVQNFLSELRVSGGHDELASVLLLQFQQSLRYRALALIHWVQQYRVKQNPLSSSAVSLLRKSLDLTSDGDFYVVLGTAEKLHPGVLAAIMPDANLS